MTITDEMMDKFEPVFLAKGLRAALEAVAPMLIAQELRKWADHRFDVISTKSLRARALELDPAMTITDEMVEKAEAAYDSDLDVFTDACDPGRLRAALEAVAPMLIAQGLREAAIKCQLAAVAQEKPVTSNPITLALVKCQSEILARAQELDPQ